MSTTTPRLQLTKPTGSESMALGASQLNDAYTKIDNAMGVRTFATQSAATSVFPGDLIYESSTGQSKLFNNPNWVNTFDFNNSRGLPQDLSPGVSDWFVVSAFPELMIDSTIITTESPRKYLVYFNLNCSAEIDGTGTQQGYVRFVFRYGTDLTVDPTIFVHDVATYIAATNASKSKNIKGMFEFFPNVEGQLKLGIFGQITSGNQDLKFNLSGSTPSMYLMDWGV